MRIEMYIDMAIAMAIELNMILNNRREKFHKSSQGMLTPCVELKDIGHILNEFYIVNNKLVNSTDSFL